MLRKRVHDDVEKRSRESEIGERREWRESSERAECRNTVKQDPQNVIKL